MRILFVTNLRYPPQGLGGARLSTHQLCEMLTARGHEVAVLAQIQNRGWLWVWNRLRAKLGGGRYPADVHIGYPVYRGWEPLDGIPEVVEKFVPQVAVAGTSATLALSAALIRQRVPTVAYFRSLEFRKFSDMPADKSLLKAVAVSRYTADRISEVLGIECEVVRSIVIPDYYLTEREPTRILHVNPDESKGIRITLELARRRPLTPKTRAIRREIQELPNVYWHEPVKDMREFYGRCRLLIVPSLWEEAAGRVVHEAQLNGIPVLASDRGGLPDSVGRGGIVLDPEAPVDTWLTALDELCEDARQHDEYSRAARAHARRDEIQPGKIIERIERLLEAHARTAGGNGAA